MNDWYSQSVRSNEELELRRRKSPLSSAWGHRRTSGEGDRGWGGRSDDSFIIELLRIRDAVRNMIRVHGVGKQCQIDLAEIGHAGAGLSGFEDAPHAFERPFIVLDKRVYETCDPSEVRDVYCGIGLHEAGHVLHTRDFFRRGKKTKGHRRVWENLWEDERIEELVRLESPGFAPYLQSAKRSLLEKGEVGEALDNWSELPDMDRLQTLIFAFIRCPHRLHDQHKLWTVVSGENMFAKLRSLFPHAPADENDVERFAKRLQDLWDRIRRLYGSEPPPNADPDALEQWQRQRQADEEDQALEEMILDIAVRLEEEGHSEEAMRLLENGLDLADSRWDKLFASRAGRRFALPDAQRLMGRTTTVHRPLSDKEAKIKARLEHERITEGDQWEWGAERETVITHPVPSPLSQEKYAAARQLVSGHIAAMRSVFRLRLGTRRWHECQLSSGRLHRRMLGRAPLTNRVFRRTHETTVPGLAMCLLVDESGSMGCCSAAGEVDRGTKAAAAFRVAVLVAESLRNVPGIELEVYSYTSCGGTDQDCLLRYLYGKRNTDVASIGGYGMGQNNYDHQAILTAARLFRDNTQNANRLMIVVSDGFPQGRGYAGQPAIKATREAVETVRRGRINVVNVAIEDFKSEEIFGQRDVLKFVNLENLVDDMRGLITRVIRRSTESG